MSALKARHQSRFIHIGVALGRGQRGMAQARIVHFLVVPQEFTIEYLSRKHAREGARSLYMLGGSRMCKLALVSCTSFVGVCADVQCQK